MTTTEALKFYNIMFALFPVIERKFWDAEFND